jgi:hypothetical protein
LSVDINSDLTFYLSIVATAVSMILGLLRIRDYTRGGLKVEPILVTPVDPNNLNVVFRIGNRDRSTSFRRAYHEWGPRSRFFYRLFVDLSHQELELRECNASAVYQMMAPRTKSELESIGTLVKLPLLIIAGDTKYFQAFLNKEDPEEKHHLVLFTTHKTYAKRLSSKLFEKGSKYAIDHVLFE